MKLAGISRNSYYKYKRELRGEMWLAYVSIACDIHTASYENQLQKKKL